MKAILLFLEVGGGEIFLILMFVLIFFGSKKIPELARGLGKGIREFKDASAGIRREIESEANKLKDDVNLQKDVNDLKEFTKE